MVLVSSGIDIGSSTMHLAVSRLILERDAGGFDVVGREVVYESPVSLTPYVAGDRIDAERVEQAFRSYYDEVGLQPDQVDTGVVILTGVALERTNARALADLIASWGGQFLSVAAGDRLEGVLAAYGSGAVARSRAVREVVNVDVGGGTVKVSWCRDGKVVDVRAFDIGTRLLAWDEARTVRRLEPSGLRLLEELGLPPVSLGDTFSEEQERELTDGVAAGLADLLAGVPDGLLARTARDRAPFVHSRAEDVVFSGGFAEYLIERERRGFGDLGLALAGAVQARFAGWDQVAASPVGIRATAIGAGQFTVQVSGITIHRSPEYPLPQRNLPVARLAPVAADVEPDDLADEVGRRLELLELSGGLFAIAVPWTGPATYDRLRACAEGLAAGVRDGSSSAAGLAVICDGDVARLLGRHLEAALGEGCPLIVVDGVEVSDLDFVDLGAPVGAYDAIPVTVKSLAFRAELGDAAPQMLEVG